MACRERFFFGAERLIQFEHLSWSCRADWHVASTPILVDLATVHLETARQIDPAVVLSLELPLLNTQRGLTWISLQLDAIYAFYRLVDAAQH